MNTQNATKIRTIQNKHDIVEMAKGQIGLKWPSPYYLKGGLHDAFWQFYFVL